MTLFSEKVLISNRCISGSMSNLIKKSWTDSNCALAYALWLKHAKDDMMQDKIEVTISYLVRGAERSTEFSKNLEKILKPSGFSGRNI